MKTNYTLFHPFFLLKKNYNPLFYRNHINFFLQLLKFMKQKKNFFLLHKKVFFDFIITYFNEYNKKQYYKKDSYIFFSIIIFNINSIQKQKNYNLYSYLISLIGTILYFSCYNIGLLSIAKYNITDKNEIITVIETILTKYEYHPKIIFITVNKQLEKGLTFSYKDLMIDLSLKKLYEILNNHITINQIGEL
jgi:hypothetical protein